MNESEPPDSDEPPLAPASQSDPYALIQPLEPKLPQFIPVARPINPEALSVVPYAVPAFEGHSPYPLRGRRAVFELVMLIPAGFFGGLLGYIAAIALRIHDQRWQLMVSTVGMGLGAMATAALFVLLDRQRAQDIGWTTRRLFTEISIGVMALLMMYFTLVFLVYSAALFYPSILDRESTAQEAVRERIPDMKLGTMLVSMFFVAVWEETVFRGFLLTRLEALLRRRWLAVPLSALIFASVHGYQGSVAVVLIFVLGLVMGILFLWRRSLVPCITMHFIHDALMLCLMQYAAMSPSG